MLTSLIGTFIFVFIATFILTGALDILFRYLGKRRVLGNLFPNVRGGIPRGVGLIPCIFLSFYMPYPYSVLVVIIGVTAFIDDIMGRRKVKHSSLEWGQLARGLGMLGVMFAGFQFDMGLSAILIALIVQPVNISDMQPGSTCIVTMIMSVVVMVIMLILNCPDFHQIPALYVPVLIFITCLAYCPLDFAGKIMLGEVGNHTFAVCLGISFYIIGGLIPTLILFIVTSVLIAFVRRNTLTVFFEKNLNLYTPVFCDYLMDVLTGGGLGDFFRKLILRNKQYIVKNPILISLVFRRLLFNPYATVNVNHLGN